MPGPLAGHLHVHVHAAVFQQRQLGPTAAEQAAKHVVELLGDARERLAESLLRHPIQAFNGLLQALYRPFEVGLLVP